MHVGKNDTLQTRYKNGHYNVHVLCCLFINTDYSWNQIDVTSFLTSHWTNETVHATKDNPHFLNIKTYLINQQISRFMKPKHIHTLYFCCNYDIPKFQFQNITTISPQNVVIEEISYLYKVSFFPTCIRVLNKMSTNPYACWEE